MPKGVGEIVAGGADGPQDDKADAEEDVVVVDVEGAVEAVGADCPRDDKAHADVDVVMVSDVGVVDTAFSAPGR